MKKILLLLMAAALLLTVSGCRKEISDSQRFKKEYEALNGQKDEEGVTYSEVHISAENTVRYCDGDKLKEVLENGTHAVYLGWPQCPWCRCMLPVLIDSVNKCPGVYIYYCNILKYREAFEKDPDSADGTFYREIAGMLDEYCSSRYDDGTARLTASNVYFIREGEIIGCHNRTVDTHLDPYEPLMDYQISELASQFDELLQEMVKDIPIGCKEC